MQDLEFYNVPVGGESLKLRLLAPFRRLARKLLLPFFTREVEIMREVLERVDDGVHAHQTLRNETDRVGGAFWQFASRVESIDEKSESLNRKFDQLNLKFDQLNQKMESMIGANKKNKSTRRMEAPGVRPRAQALSLQHAGFRGRFRLASSQQSTVKVAACAPLEGKSPWVNG